MARFKPPIPFPTGRSQKGTYKYGVFISDQLIIFNTHPEFSTGGVGRWQTTFANRVIAEAVRLAPEGKFADHLHMGGAYVPGEYKRSFKLTKFGGNHVRNRLIGNTAPHAYFVEAGRAPSGPAWETYSTRHKGGRIISTKGTSGFLGTKVLSTALANASARGVGKKISTTFRSAGQTLAAAENLQGFRGPNVAPDEWIIR